MVYQLKNIIPKQCVSPPKRGAVEPVNLKTLRNPAKTAQMQIPDHIDPPVPDHTDPHSGILTP